MHLGREDALQESVSLNHSVPNNDILWKTVHYCGGISKESEGRSEEVGKFRVLAG